ncbi:distal tail protein Dit [Cytobacillus firmus]|uniref:distal tail protein Dit n=1 Tax=Cytobacillus firmus TaxID=1399 RepID=UPI0036782980
MLLSFSFNGVTKPYIKCEKGKVRQIYNIKRNMLYIPGRIGAYLDRTDIDIKIIEQPVIFEGVDKLNLRKLEEELSSWLITEQPGELIFNDEPDRIYYAVVDGSLNVEEIANFGRGTIRFICPDPYKYTKEFTKSFAGDVASIRNLGTAEAKPVFEMNVLEPVTYAMIENQYKKYLMIGRPYDVTAQQPFVREELVFDKLGNSLSGWSQGLSVDGGVVDGLFYINGSAFRAQTYGANATAWHGPAIQQSLPELLTDFKIQTFFTVKPKTEKSFGRAELYLVNAGGQKIAKLAMKNIGSDGGSNVGEVILRNEASGDQEVMIRTPGIRERLWNNFYGVLRLERSNGIYKAYIAMVDTKTGQYHTAWHAEFRDEGNVYDDQLAAIQLHLGAYAGLQWIEDIAIHRVTVYKINQPFVNEVPYIAYPGDTIVFDMVNENILINGESRVDLKDFGGEYFPLESNLNDLRVFPGGSFQTKARYRERYK